MGKNEWDDTQVIEEKSSDLKCYHCNTLLTENEASRYYNKVKYYCSGHMYGCMGMTVKPPFCDRCIETWKYAKLGQAIEKWFEKGYVAESSGNKIWNRTELIEWYKEVKNV